jgi:hypothetical protein
MSHGVEGPTGVRDDRPGQRLGSLIGAMFGLIYVEANAGALPAPAALLVSIVGVMVFVGVMGVLVKGRRPGPSSRAPAREGFGRSYWLVVGVEVAAFVGGSAIIRGPLDLPRAVVAWISVVVGVHFFALAAIWRMSFFRRLGAAIALCGIAGLVAAGAGASNAVIATLGAVIPGALLLAAGYWGATHSANHAKHEQPLPGDT